MKLTFALCLLLALPVSLSAQTFSALYTSQLATYQDTGFGAVRNFSGRALSLYHPPAHSQDSIWAVTSGGHRKSTITCLAVGAGITLSGIASFITDPASHMEARPPC